MTKDWRYGEPLCPIFVPLRQVGTHEECRGCPNCDGGAVCEFFLDLGFTSGNRFFGYKEGYRTIYEYPIENLGFYRVLTARNKDKRRERLNARNMPLGFLQRELDEVRHKLFNQEHMIYSYKQNIRKVKPKEDDTQ